jgi:PiT family inorganic phosphate transporter
MPYDILFVVVAVIVGLWMTWGIGANDLANIMSTTMGSKALSVRQALTIAVIFEFLGAFFGGAEVSATVRTGIIDLSVVKLHPDLFIYSMLAVLLAGSTWITLASLLGMPVSITQAIIGALVGVGAIALGVDKVAWLQVSYIFITWIVAPFVAGFIAFSLFVSIRKFIFAAQHPLAAARYIIPGYFFLVGIVLAMMTILKILDHYQIITSVWLRFCLVMATALTIVLIGLLATAHIKRRSHFKQHNQLQYIEQLFSVLMAGTSCAMVFAHGSNDVAIAISPVIAVINTVFADEGYFNNNHLLLSISLFIGCAGVMTGFLMYGRKVIATVGSGITVLTPSRAFAATFAAAGIVVTATTLGLPISATQTLVGAVLGVGLARGIEALNLTVIRNIILSWLLTVPISAILATIFFMILQKLLA